MTAPVGEFQVLLRPFTGSVVMIRPELQVFVQAAGPDDAVIQADRVINSLGGRFVVAEIAEWTTRPIATA